MPECQRGVGGILRQLLWFLDEATSWNTRRRRWPWRSPDGFTLRADKTIFIFRLHRIHWAAVSKDSFCFFVPPQTTFWWIPLRSLTFDLQWDALCALPSPLEPEIKRRRRRRSEKAEGILKPGVVGFGSGYILEYNTGILAVILRAEKQKPLQNCVCHPQKNSFWYFSRELDLGNHNWWRTEIHILIPAWLLIVIGSSPWWWNTSGGPGLLLQVLISFRHTDGSGSGLSLFPGTQKKETPNF